MTHRVFSRNAASSRAIPLQKTLKRISEDPAQPVKWTSEQKGMQGGDEVERPDFALDEWLAARDAVIGHAEAMGEMGVHKSIVNRMLEPWVWMTTIITATEWDGFWHQRDHEAAQPEFRVLARVMRDAYNSSEPSLVPIGGWHLPYIRLEDEADPWWLQQWREVAGSSDRVNTSKEFERFKKGTLCKISAARCARVSYLTHDGIRDLVKDLTLYDRLVHRTEFGPDGLPKDPIHWSPLEHVATPCRGTRHTAHRGNLVGWDQLRHIVEDSYFGDPVPSRRLTSS